MDRRPIEGFPDYFIEAGTDACPRGKVFSNKSGVMKELKPMLNGHGYYYVSLCVDGKRINKQLHRLIAEEFIPLEQDRNFIDHINRIRADNMVLNLRWSNRQENGLNCNTPITNTSGFKGVRFRDERPCYPWTAQIQIKGKNHSMRFKTEIEAKFQRVKWEIFYEIPNHQRVKLKLTRL